MVGLGIWATLSRLELEYAGLNVGKNKFGLQFYFLFLVGPQIGPAGPDEGSSRSREKNPLSKWAGSGPQVLARRSSLGMEKHSPNLTRCHSYKQIRSIVLDLSKFPSLHGNGDGLLFSGIFRV